MTLVLYTSESIPSMQNKLYSSQQEACEAPQARASLATNHEGIVYNRDFSPELVAYDETYQNDQSQSLQFKHHLDSVVALCKSYVTEPQSLVVDVGCGKGAFVELLRDYGVNAVGYDNAYQGSNPSIRKCFFDKGSHEKGELLTLRHVLEHINDPHSFLIDLAEANGHHGHIYIEVPDLDWILDQSAFFDIFHEHVNYFRMSDFERLYGDSIVQASKSFGGQYLSIFLNLESISQQQPAAQYSSSDFAKLQKRFDRLIEKEVSTYQELAASTEIVIWGAAAKGVMFAAKAPASLRTRMAFAIDINPYKQNQYMPVSGLEVLDPTTGLSRLGKDTTVVIMNPNYEKEIKACLPYNQPCMVLN